MVRGVVYTYMEGEVECHLHKYYGTKGAEEMMRGGGTREGSVSFKPTTTLEFHT